MRYPAAIEKLMSYLHKLPGVGRRTAERYAFDLLLGWDHQELHELQHSLSQLKCSVILCDICGTLSEKESCLFCSNNQRRRDLLCIVATPREVFSLEATKEFHGIYHVLGGLLSPLDGRGEEVVQLDKLTARLASGEIQEIVIALDSTLEGDATALFLKQELEAYQVKVSRLAFGIPVGSSLEYVDGGTLARAFVGRNSF